MLNTRTSEDALTFDHRLCPRCCERRGDPVFVAWERGILKTGLRCPACRNEWEHRSVAHDPSLTARSA